MCNLWDTFNEQISSGLSVSCWWDSCACMFRSELLCFFNFIMPTNSTLKACIMWLLHLSLRGNLISDQGVTPIIKALRINIHFRVLEWVKMVPFLSCNPNHVWACHSSAALVAIQYQMKELLWYPKTCKGSGNWKFCREFWEEVVYLCSHHSKHTLSSDITCVWICMLYNFGMYYFIGLLLQRLQILELVHLQVLWSWRSLFRN